MKYIHYLLFVLSLLFSGINYAATLEKPMNVLFIGNSFIGANYLPFVLKELAAANNKTINVEAEIKNGTALYQHWQQGIASEKITEQPWDFVILQDASASAFEHPDKTLTYGKLFADLITKHQSKPLFFNTWAYHGIPDWVKKLPDAQEKAELSQFIPHMYEATNKLYQQLGQASGATVIPIAQVWHEFTEENPNIALHAKDNSHPSPVGTYLTALSFYYGLFDELPEVLPATIYSVVNQEKMHDKLTIDVPNDLSKKMITALKSIK